MSQDRDLRTLLAKIAASAGDPPEHGLDRVVSRRRRRTRRRRGAVATAAALAALTIGAMPWLTGQQNDHDVSAERPGEPGSHPADIPDVVQLQCMPQGTKIPVASIKPQDDGLHVNVYNSLGKSTDVWVRSDGWDSGRISAPPGSSEVRQAVPPGTLTIGCDINGHEDSLEVRLVDADEIYRPPELACADEDKTELERKALSRSTKTPAEGVRDFLAMAQAEPPSTDTIEPSTGYPTKRYDKTKPPDETTELRVQVVRGSEVLAIVSLYDRNDSDDVPRAPDWTDAEGELCPQLKDGTTTTEPVQHDPPD